MSFEFLIDTIAGGDACAPARPMLAAHSGAFARQHKVKTKPVSYLISLHNMGGHDRTMVTGHALQLPAPWAHLRVCVSRHGHSRGWQIDHFPTGFKVPMMFIDHPIEGGRWHHHQTMEQCIRRLLYYLEAECAPRELAFLAGGGNEG